MFSVMEIVVLVFLAAAAIVIALVTWAHGSTRSWDHTDAWNALKRVGDEASRGKTGGNKGDGIRRSAP